MADKQYYLNNPALPTSRASFEYTPQMIKDIKKCGQNILHFAENFFYIIDPDEGKTVINLFKCQKQALRTLRDNRYNILLASRQIGKALDVETPIPTPNGWTTMGQLKDGDQVYAADGSICNVVKAHEVMHDRKCFKVVFDNGEEIIADADHLWFTQNRLERRNKQNGTVKTTAELFNTLATHGGEPNHRIPTCIAGVEGKHQELPIDPYVLGLWLGDGCSASGYITVGIRDLQEIVDNLKECEQFNEISIKEYNTDVFSVRISNSENKHTQSLTSLIKTHNLINNKHIPDIYLRASREQRMELLKGLIDSDGYVMKTGVCQFYNTNHTLVDQTKQLVESLGYKVTSKTYIPTINGIECAPASSITFTPIEPVCKLSFKLKRIKIKPYINSSKHRAHWHYIKDIQEVASVPVRCITVDSKDNLYLCGKQYIPTHNTTMLTIYALWVACFNEDQNIVIVANKESTAIEIFRRVRMAYEQLPNWLKPGVIEYGKTSMMLDNGSRIGISTTTGSAARGTSLNVLILDELAFIDPPSIMEDFWRSVWPTISRSKKSKVLIASTPNGTDNLFYKLYDGSMRGENSFITSVIKWDDVPGRDEEWRKEQIKILGSIESFEQEFNCTFLQKGESSIDAEQFERFKSMCSDPVLSLDDGKYKIWRMPEENRIYVAGIDVSEGVGQDYSVIQILDITDLSNIEQVACYRNNAIDVPSFTTKAHEILVQWGKPLAMIERNNCGAQVVDNLYNIHKYENIVNYGSAIAGRKKEQLGVIAHTNTKHKGVLNMRYWVNELECIRFNDINTISELKEFVRKPNGSWSARGNNKDDSVMSLIWALMILENDANNGICQRYFEIIDVDDNGKPKVIKPMDFGLKYFTRPAYDSLRSHNSYNEMDVMPMVFGAQTMQNDDMEELQMAGWTML